MFEILKNERIWSKFTIENQIIFWKALHQISLNNISKFKSIFRLNKMIYILKYYDRNKFTEYCCQTHAKLFIDEYYTIMNPSLCTIVSPIINIIQSLINSANLIHHDEYQLIVQLLALDVSPCLQKMIICLFIVNLNF